MDRFCLGDNTITFSDDFAKLNELRKGISCISRYAKIGTYIAQRMQETGQKPNVDRIAQGFLDIRDTESNTTISPDFRTR